MRAAALLLLLAASSAAGPPAAPQEWLVIERVDLRGRRPFNPDTVFYRYLLRRGAPPPKAGEKVGGAEWRKLAADDKGRVGGRIAYAYATVTSAADTIVLARLHRGARLYVNGDAFVGDIYGSKSPGMPVLLRKGLNHLFVRGVRGSFKLTFPEVPRGITVSPLGATLPDAVKGRTIDTEAGVILQNASTKAAEGICPLGLRKLPVKVNARTFQVRGTEFKLELREPNTPFRRTFSSAIDGSVQEYSVLAPEQPGPQSGLVLTLHGAGVDAYNQARSYSRKRDLWIVAPTNRRPFGFDWQDWGRQDAYEVLEDALEFTGASPDRVYLTGHSMGGHGTWHLAANDPDRFAAIAPSAGWATFDSYVGRPGGRLDTLWRGADGASLTLDLIPNLAQVPTFILHGEADDNVPVREAYVMETLLTGHGALPLTHYRPGAGHWWNGKAAKGTDCVDWPGIFALFQKHRRKPAPRRLDFLSVDPGVDAEHYWLRFQQPLEYGRRARLRATIEKGVVSVRTDNVRRFGADPPGGAARFSVDGTELATNPPAWFLRTTEGWTVAPVEAGEKSPERSGPFKRAFDNRFVFVHGDLEGMRRARYDAQAWWYRGNGDVEVVSDEAFLRHGHVYRGRNVIVYGNAQSNGAWDAVFDKACPIRMEDRALSVGETNWFGSGLCCLFVYPRKGEPRALAAAFAHGDEEAARVGYSLLPFVSGVGYPDYVAFTTQVLLRGDEGVLSAGWFGPDWSLPR